MTPSLVDVFNRAVEQFGERVAIRGPARQLTFSELGRRTLRRTEAFCSLGIPLDGARVGVLLPNVTHFPEVVYGIVGTGASALLLNPLCSVREIAEYVRDAGATLVFTTPQLQTQVPSDVRAVVVEAERGAVTASDPPELSPPTSVNPDGEAAVVYTAATQGWSRGARLSHRNLVANLESTIEAMRLGPEDRVLGLLPWVHLFGLTVTLNAPLAAGACLLPVERFHPTRTLQTIAEQRVTVLCGVPAIFAALVAATSRTGVPAHALRVAISGGAPLPLEIARRWEELFGLPLRQGYGLTEAGPVCLFNRVDRPNRLGTLGYPFPGVEVTVRHNAGHVLPAGEVGEICIAGDNVFGGYVGENERNQADFFGDALRTGDLGSTEEDGAIRFRGFLKPMFTRNGFNVYPREVERALREDARIGAVAVYARPDAARENEVVLVVRPTAGTELSEHDVRATCAERLAAYKQPGRIRIDTAVS